jgi:hypothetical protein
MGMGVMGQWESSKMRRNHGIDDGGMNETVGVWLERVNF